MKLQTIKGKNKNCKHYKVKYCRHNKKSQDGLQGCQKLKYKRFQWQKIKFKRRKVKNIRKNVKNVLK